MDKLFWSMGIRVVHGVKQDVFVVHVVCGLCMGTIMCHFDTVKLRCGDEGCPCSFCL